MGVHQHFRMINLYLSVNADATPSGRFTMTDIRKKLTSFYDEEFIQADSAKTDFDEDRAPLEVAFELPYAEYREFIEAHAKVDAESVPASPSVRDHRSSPTQSVKTESIVPDGGSDEEDEGEEEEAEAVVVVGKGRPRKRAAAAMMAAATTTTKERGTPRTKHHSGSVSGSLGTGTPGKETDEESVAGSTTKANNKKQRTAPSRKSTRKR